MMEMMVNNLNDQISDLTKSGNEKTRQLQKRISAMAVSNSASSFDEGTPQASPSLAIPSRKQFREQHKK